MTADTRDLDALHAALDADPSDRVTRLALADWYEEYGDDVMAAGLRWMVGFGVRPGRSGGRHVWRRFGVGYEDRQVFLPDDLFDRLRGQVYPAAEAVGTKGYRSRRAAEEALCRAPVSPAVATA